MTSSRNTYRTLLWEPDWCPSVRQSRGQCASTVVLSTCGFVVLYFFRAVPYARFTNQGGRVPLQMKGEEHERACVSVARQLPL